MDAGESHVTDDDRTAYLAGEPGADIDPDERAGLDGLRALLADPAVWAEPRPGLEHDVVDAVTQAKGANDVPDGADDAIVSGRAVWRWKRFAVVAGAVAAVVVAIGLSVGLSQGGSHATQYRVALSGTVLAPGARGGATLTETVDGWRVTLHASGLPRLDNGAFYEAWLKNAAGVLVPIGTFNQPGSVTLWSGVPPTSFPTLTVTRQLANGVESSSGQRVLVGTARPAH
jgi:Anti-sigma-K factor rskA